MHTIGHIYFSALSNDSRSFRSAKAGLIAGIAQRTFLVGYWEPGLRESETPMPGMEILRLKFLPLGFMPRLIRRALRWFLWCPAAARKLIRNRPTLLHCHSLAALKPAVDAKMALGIPLIYDARELETERNGWKWLQKVVAKRVEARLIRHVDAVLVVSDSIADWYRETYGLSNVTVVRNVPESPAYLVSRNRRIRDDFGLGDDDLVFIYLGAISDGRGWTQIVEAFKTQALDHHMVFVGDGPDAEKIAAISESVRNVHWHPPVPISEVPQYAAGADVGISLIEDTCLSYRYCLPNKVHEYRIAGLPVIVSNLTELSRFIEKTGCGWTVSSDGDNLAALIASLDRKTIRRKLADTREPPITWDDEKVRYIAVLNRLLAE